MNQLKDIKTLIHSILDGGDILFIVPPFAMKEYARLGLHILKAIAEKQGYKTEILYLNILLASIVGEGTYDNISNNPYNQQWMKLGERLFAKNAYGLPSLGKTHEFIDNETMCITGKSETHMKVSYETIDFDLDNLLKLEEICTCFINETIQAIALLDYKMIGCSNMVDQNNCSITILKGIKKIHPRVVTLIGGANCEGEMAQGIASLSESIDYIFSGESDKTFEEFLKEYSTGKLPSQRIITGEPLENLDTLPLPDYDGFIKQIRQIFGETPPFQAVIVYETSRGCWKGQKHKCFFCGNNTNKGILYRQKSEEKAVKELVHLNDKYSTSGIMLTDNIIPPSYYRKVFPLLAERISSSMWYQENTNIKLEDMISIKKAHINTVVFGIESLSTGLLSNMNKYGASAWENILLLRNAMSVGMYIIWFMLWGFPGDRVEYYQDILNLLPLIRHLQPPWEFLHLKLVRFSHYLENLSLHQITNLRPLEIYRSIYPDGANIENLAYEFTGQYPCEAHENPGIIKMLANEIEVWKKSHGNTILAMMNMDDYYIIHDSRNLLGTKQNYILDPDQAKEIMTYCKYDKSQHREWAVEKKLGVILDSWYVPLVTASPELLIEFETKG